MWLGSVPVADGPSKLFPLTPSPPGSLSTGSGELLLEVEKAQGLC